MATRRKRQSSRLPLPWERGHGLYQSLFAGRRFLPLLVLIVISGLLWGAYFLGGRRVDVRATRATIHEVERATRAFVADIGRCPRNVSELVNPPRSGVHYLSEAPDDAWGKPLFLSCSAGAHTDIEVLSAGPSGSFLDDDNVM